MNFYWVASDLLDGLVIDPECSYTAGDLMSNLEKDPPKWVVNTHDYVDHIGANRPIQERFGINIYASPDAEITGGKANALEAAERKKGIMESCNTEGRKWWL